MPREKRIEMNLSFCVFRKWLDSQTCLCYEAKRSTRSLLRLQTSYLGEQSLMEKDDRWNGNRGLAQNE